MLKYCELTKKEMEEIIINLLKRLKEEVYLVDEDFISVANGCGVNDEHLEFWELLEEEKEEER